MNVNLDSARLEIYDLSELKNSTLGLDSGLASSNEVSQSSGDQNVTRRFSALSSIQGITLHVGEFPSLNRKSVFLFFLR